MNEAIWFVLVCHVVSLIKASITFSHRCLYILYYLLISVVISVYMLVVKLLRNGFKMAKASPCPTKAALRAEIAERIAALSAEEKKRQSQIVYDKIINHPWYKSSSRISLYMSTDQEIDTAPLISHIKARGGAAFVPQYAGGKMRMLRLEEDDERKMPLTRHGIQQHSKEQTREDAVESGGLDLIIAPGVAFSRSGARCGHGGGYYDKFISNLRSTQPVPPKVVAVAFDCQVVDNVPSYELDQKVDAVIFAE